MAPSVRKNPDKSRFEVVVDDQVAGVAAYRMDGDRLVFTHTEVEDEHEGEGLGGLLVKSALEEARLAQRKIVPLCPFVASYIGHHPEYDDLVDHETTKRLQEG